MKSLRVGLVVAALVLVAGIARADGLDPVLKMGDDGTSTPCVSFQGSTGDSGTFFASCVNDASTAITSFSFEILSVDAPGGITPELDCHLAPFQSGCPLANPALASLLDWTASCTTSGAVDICTASMSQFVTTAECDSYFLASLCSPSITAAEIVADEADNAGLAALLAPYGGNPCDDPWTYVVLGIIPGCDASAGTVTGGGDFVADALFDIVPAGTTPAPLPEPSSLSLLLIGLSGLPLLRRKFAR